MIGVQPRAPSARRDQRQKWKSSWAPPNRRRPHRFALLTPEGGQFSTGLDKSEFGFGRLSQRDPPHASKNGCRNVTIWPNLDTIVLMSIDSGQLLKESGTKPEAFGSFYRRHFEDVLVFLTRRTGDAEAGLDLAAETFAQAYLSRRRFRGDTEPEAAAWLFTIARRQLAAYARRGEAQKRALQRLRLERPDLDPTREQAIIELAGLAELRSSLVLELSQLSERAQQAVHLRVVDELSFRDIARQLGITEPAARKRVSRALMQLSEAFFDQGTGAPETALTRASSKEAFT